MFAYVLFFVCEMCLGCVCGGMVFLNGSTAVPRIIFPFSTTSVIQAGLCSARLHSNTFSLYGLLKLPAEVANEGV